MPRGILRIPWLVLAAAMGLLLAGALRPASAESPTIAVVYPDVREPFLGVFLKIISGIEDGLNSPVKKYPLDDATNVPALASDLNRDHVDAVIALGHTGLNAAEKLRGKFPIVVGAISNTPGAAVPDLPGITLNPDPDVMFEWLKRLAPDVKRVSVVYNQAHGDRSMDRARESAKAHGLVLNALPSDNLRAAAASYRQVLSRVSDTPEGLWLMQDDTVLDETTLLPAILKEAWERNLIVFCSAPEFVKKGALFALYPDSVGMGRSLAAMARQQLQASRAKGSPLMPLRDLLIAINVRTAEHLGLRYPMHDLNRFDMVFPAP